MTREILIKITLVFLLAACAGTVFAQAENAPNAAPDAAPNAASSADVMGEDDRLPFMQTEQKPEMQESGSGGLILRTLGSMILICGLIFLAAWGLKKFGFAGLKPNAAESPDLAVISTVSLGSNRTISSVRFGEKILLVGSTAHAFTLLAETSPNAKISAEAQSDHNPRSVAELLAEEENFTPPQNFGKEFERAQLQLDGLREEGGKIS